METVKVKSKELEDGDERSKIGIYSKERNSVEGLFVERHNVSADPPIHHPLLRQPHQLVIHLSHDIHKAITCFTSYLSTQDTSNTPAPGVMMTIACPLMW